MDESKEIMKLYPSAEVLHEDGRTGIIKRIDYEKSRVEILMSDGRFINIPAELIQQKHDGSLFLPQELGALPAAPPQVTPRSSLTEAVIPVVQEVAKINKRWVDQAKVTISKTVQEEPQRVSVPLAREQVKVERIEKNTYLEEPAKPRHEGETLVLPVMEEVLVVEKRLILREEIRVTIERMSSQEEVEVMLKKEVLKVQKKPSGSEAG